MASDQASGDPPTVGGAFDNVEYLLFDSLVHHLIEKGLLTKNDALSVIQTAAEVVRGRAHDNHAVEAIIDRDLAKLERTYSSFEALPDRQGRSGLAAPNVHQLRTPLHGETPHFPKPDDN